MILVAVVYPVGCYSRNEPCELSLISTFLLLSLGRYLSFHWKLHCSRHDIAEKLLRWRKPIIHSLTHSIPCTYLIRNRNCLLLREPGFLGSPDWLVGTVLPNFVFCLVHLTIPVSLDCPFLIDPSVFSNVY